MPNNLLSSSATGKVSEYAPQYLTATQADNYVITTTGTIIETGEKFTAHTEVLVTEGELPPDMGELSTWPLSLSTGNVTDVLFTLNFDGYDLDKIISIKLNNLENGSSLNMYDSVNANGRHNGSYAATIAIDTESMDSGDCLKYRLLWRRRMEYITQMFIISAPVYFQVHSLGALKEVS